MKTHLSLFSGIGGLDLAAEMAGFQTVGRCKWADYPTKVLEKHWPDVPRWRDIRTLTGGDFYEQTGLRTVDVLSGGFPWPEMLRVISEIRPAWVLGENVPGIVNLALDQVLADLENQGYACQTFVVPACGVDAPHKRARVAIVAHSNSVGQLHGKPEKQSAKAGKHAQRESIECSQTVADTDNRRGPLRRDGELSTAPEAQNGWRNLGGGAPKYVAGEWRPTEPGLCGVVDGLLDWLGGYWPAEPAGIPRIATGISHRVDQLKCYGNAVVPQQFYPFFKYISELIGA